MDVTAERRDVAAFERFFLDEYPKLIAFGLAWTGDRDAACEHAQETLSRSFSHWDRVGALNAPGAWARKVLLRILIDEHRRDGRQTRLVSQLAVATPRHTEGPDPVDDAWWRAVRALPDQERAAVTLFYVDDFSIAEVATILEVAPGTVKATLSHARRKLRTVLAEGATS